MPDDPCELTEFNAAEDEMPYPQEVARRPFVEGRDIELEDGQVWTFPLPRIEFRLTDSGPLERKVEHVCETNRKFGPQFWSLQEKLGEYIDRTDKVPDGEPGGFNLIEYYRLLKAVASDLLRRNYELNDAELSDLLSYVDGDEANRKMWLSINEVARGIGGRPQAVAEAG